MNNLIINIDRLVDLHFIITRLKITYYLLNNLIKSYFFLCF